MIAFKNFLSFEHFKTDLPLKWHYDSPKKVLKGGKQGGAVAAKIKERVIDLPESQELNVLCVQILVYGATGQYIARFEVKCNLYYI